MTGAIGSHSDPPHPRRVLIVEMNAHQGFGHSPVAFAELATELIALGCQVEALTSRGWFLAGDPGFPPLEIRRLGTLAEAIFRRFHRLRNTPQRPLGKRLGEIGRTSVIVYAASRLLRRGSFSDVIVFTQLDPLVGVLLATRGRWLSYQFSAPQTASATGAAGRGERRFLSGIDRCVRKLSEVKENRGHRRGPHLRIATGVQANTEAWAAVAPWLEPVTIPFIAVRPRNPIRDARRRLELPNGVPVALLFGDHPAKDSETVWRAFAGMPERRLMIGGSSAAASYRKWASRHAAVDATPILFDGYADEETRALLYAAADLVVISFRPDTQSDSGNLVDAIAWGRTVVCSERCPSAEIVRHHRLGAVFEPGNVESLIEAVRNAPLRPDADGLRTARAEFAARRIAQRNLEALDSVGQSGIRSASEGGRLRRGPRPRWQPPPAPTTSPDNPTSRAEHHAASREVPADPLVPRRTHPRASRRPITPGPLNGAVTLDNPGGTENMR